MSGPLTFARRVATGVKRRLIPPHRRGADLAHDLRRLLAVESVRTVVDVGANSGQSAVFFHRLFPRARIVSLEPVASVFKELVSTTRTLPRVECVRVAVGEAERDVRINTFETTQLSSINCVDDSSGTEWTRMTTLVALAERLDIRAIDLLKIDVEGYETQVLSGASRLLAGEAVSLILIEAGIDDANMRFTPLTTIRQDLSRHGYEVYGFYDQASWDDSTLLYVNVLFASPPLVKAMRAERRTRKIALPCA